MWIKNGLLLTREGDFCPADVELQEGCITAVGTAPAGAQGLDAGGCYVLPGLVDIHIHGAMGADFSDGDAAGDRTMARYLLTQGVTSYLGTSMSLPPARLEQVYAAARPRVDRTVPGQATLRGINMEGPFLNEEKGGAQNPAYIIPPDFDLFLRLQRASGGNIRTVAVAPEVPGGLDFVAKARDCARVSLAHSCADFSTACAAFDRGADHVTHIFNAMSPFGHRDPGIVGAAADREVYVELICDGVHVHPAVVRAVFALFGPHRVCLISDAMRACGMPDGRYDLGGRSVTVANHRATTDAGSLAGSVSSLLQCLRTAVELGVPLGHACLAATCNPACSVGLDDKVGVLAPGRQADLILLDRDLELKQVLLAGAPC